jgi:polygalacturonase
MTTLVPKFQQTGTGAVNRAFTLKLKDYVSVTDFGAVGDNATDDTTAFNNAIATGKQVYVPAGTYLINATINNKTPKMRAVLNEEEVMFISRVCSIHPLWLLLFRNLH